MLPYRYRVGWKPSWANKDQAGLEYEYEDANTGTLGKSQIIIAATRIADKAPVMIKHVSTDTPELSIMAKLSSEPLANHPDNRSLPLLDTVLLPDSDDSVYLIVPQLRPFHNPPFETPAEIMHCFRRYLQGLQFLHEHNVAHLDIDHANAMMDARSMFPRGFDTVTQEYYRPSDPLSERTRLKRAPRVTRTLSDVKYYFIDFGLSKIYPTGFDAADPLERGPRGHVIAPEMLTGRLYDPMAADVYALGSLFEFIIEVAFPACRLCRIC